nr:MAG TPA: hypothetical protein [Caudoviricetes sp.]
MVKETIPPQLVPITRQTVKETILLRMEMVPITRQTVKETILLQMEMIPITRQTVKEMKVLQRTTKLPLWITLWITLLKKEGSNPKTLLRQKKRRRILENRLG